MKTPWKKMLAAGCAITLMAFMSPAAGLADEETSPAADQIQETAEAVTEVPAEEPVIEETAEPAEVIAEITEETSEAEPEAEAEEPQEEPAEEPTEEPTEEPKEELPAEPAEEETTEQTITAEIIPVQETEVTAPESESTEVQKDPAETNPENVTETQPEQPETTEGTAAGEITAEPANSEHTETESEQEKTQQTEVQQQNVIDEDKEESLIGIIEEGEKKVYIFCTRKKVMSEGDPVELTSLLEGFDGHEIHYQWECDKHDEAGFKSIEGANEDSFTFLADAESLSWSWRLIVSYL